MISAGFLQASPDEQTRRDYWLCQCGGWGGLAALGVLSSSGSKAQMLQFAPAKTCVVLAAFVLSHLWRLQLRRRHWVDRLAGMPLGRLAAGLALLSIVQTGCLIVADLPAVGSLTSCISKSA